MKKNLRIAMMAIVLLVPTKNVMAVDPVNVGVDVKTKTNVTNNIETGSKSESSATGGTGIGEGGAANSSSNLTYNEKTQLPAVSQYYPGMVNTQLGSDNYGSSVAMFSNYDILGNGCRVWTMAKHRVKIEAMRQVENSVSWDKMMDLTIAYPNVEKKFSSIGEGQVYLYDSIDLVRGMGLREEDFVGTVSYDTELSKKYFVPQSYLGERACYDGSQLFGANLTVRLGEFNNGHFIASGNSFSLGGIFSTVLNCVSGSGASAGAGTSGAKNSKVITNGAVYGLFRISGQPQVCKPTVEMKAITRSLPWWMEYALKGGKKHCPDKCINNACLRTQAAFDYALKGQWKKAENEAQIGQRDIAGGIEQDGTKTITLEAAPILAKVLRRIEMLSVREQFGRASEVSLATKYRSMYGDTSMPTEIGDLYKSF